MIKRSLMCATVLAGAMLTQSASAQSSDQINAIRRQIDSLQTQLSHMKADVAKRDDALRAAQQQAREAQQQAQEAQERADQIAVHIPATPIAPEEPPLPKGTFRLGGLTVTLGGFIAAEGVYRSRNEAASIASSFGGIPLRNSPNFYIPENRITAQQSRLSLLVQGQLDPVQSLTGYVETDFLSAGTSSNSNESNSYTLRMRQFWGSYDNTNFHNSGIGLHFLGGQAWSLATPYRVGLVPRQENVPLTIDAQYAVGFTWARQPQFRITTDFDHHKIWAGLSVESPQTLFGSQAGPNCLTGANAATAVDGGRLEYTQCGGPNVNSIQSYSDSIAPDVIAKVAADPGYGHYELYGLLRFLGGRTSFLAYGTGENHWTLGGGIGGSMILPVIPKKLDFQVSGLVGRGIGRYGSGQLPDATFSPSGQIEPLAGYAVMAGLVGHPTPTIDLYAYAGAEGVGNTGAYGNPHTILAGCQFELGSCSASTSSLLEGTVGGWWRLAHGSYGTVQVGAQYEYVKRNTYPGVGLHGATISPATDENMFLVSFRYYPFQ